MPKDQIFKMFHRKCENSRQKEVLSNPTWMIELKAFKQMKRSSKQVKAECHENFRVLKRYKTIQEKWEETKEEEIIERTKEKK